MLLQLINTNFRKVRFIHSKYYKLTISYFIINILILEREFDEQFNTDLNKIVQFKTLLHKYLTIFSLEFK